MTVALIIPIHLDALFLPSDRLVVEAMFDRDVKTIDSLKPEALRSGFTVENLDDKSTAANTEEININTPEAAYKLLKNSDRRKSHALKVDAIPWRQNRSALDITQLVESIQQTLKGSDQESLTAAQFALQMVEGIDQVRFVAKPLT